MVLGVDREIGSDRWSFGSDGRVVEAFLWYPFVGEERWRVRERRE